MTSDIKRAVVVGQGYVGLPVAVRAVHAGYDVVGFEVDDRKVEALNAGTSHVEDISDAEMSSVVSTGRYRATATETEIAEFDVAVISVPTRAGGDDDGGVALR